VTVIDKNLIMPLVLKLAWETGLNPGSIKNLKRDCYRESHPTTGLPYISYYKARSTGEKELHLALFDLENQSGNSLLPKRSEIIRETIDLLLKLTEPLVARARPQDKDFLLLLENNTQHISGYSVVRLSTGILCGWSSQIKKRLKKEGGVHNSSDGSALRHLNLLRFRATKITEMVLHEHDFFRIQAVAGHASVNTTMKYLTAHKLDLKARQEIEAVLIRIHCLAQEQNGGAKPFAGLGGERGTPNYSKGV
jgi:integrase